MITLDFRMKDRWGIVSKFIRDYETTVNLVVPPVGATVVIPRHRGTVKEIVYIYEDVDTFIQIFFDNSDA